MANQNDGFVASLGVSAPVFSKYLKKIFGCSTEVQDLFCVQVLGRLAQAATSSPDEHSAKYNHMVNKTPYLIMNAEDNDFFRHTVLPQLDIDMVGVLTNGKMTFYYMDVFEKKAWVYHADSITGYQRLLQPIMDGEVVCINRIHKPRTYAMINAPGIIVCKEPLNDATDAQGAFVRRTRDIDMRADHHGLIERDDLVAFKEEMTRAVLPASVAEYMRRNSQAAHGSQNA